MDGQEPERTQDPGFALPADPPPGDIPPAPYAPAGTPPAPYATTAPYGTAPYGTGTHAATAYATGPYGAPPPERPSNPQATASLVLGILSVLLSLLFVPAILGVVLGVIGLNRSGRTDPPVGRGSALAGIILSVVGAILGVVLAVGVGSSISDLADEIEREVASAEADGTGPTGDVDGQAEAPRPEEFVRVGPAQWARIMDDPERATGRAVVVFAEVVRFDNTTGEDRFLAAAGVDQPGAPGELQGPSVFIGDTKLLDGVESGDVLEVHAVVTGSLEYRTELDGRSVVPTLTMAKVKDVGFADLSADLTLGAAAPDQIGLLSLPVTVVNSGAETFTYSAQVVAESKDGQTTYETGTVFVENIKAGRREEVTVTFFEQIPADAVFRVDFVDRYIE